MALPTLTESERRANLAKAMRARAARARIRRQLQEGTLTAEQVIESEDRDARRMPVAALVRSLPGVGEARAQRILEQAEVSPKKRVGGLGARQRERLIDVLGRYLGRR